MSQEMEFSKAVMIIKDIKRKQSWDVIRILEKLDDKPMEFDFGAGKIVVVRYVVETVDARMLLFVPAVKSFIKKVQIKKFFQIGSKRTYNYEPAQSKTNEFIIYINRIKNLNKIDLPLKQRIHWKKQTKTKEISFPFDEKWLGKCLPIHNNLQDCQHYFETLEDIDCDTLLSTPLKILRLQFVRQIEVVEPCGSIIKNLEYHALSHCQKTIRLYIPYFLKDLINHVISKFLNNNLIINRLKIFYKKYNSEIYAGFLWDPTLSGFITVPKENSEKLLSLKGTEDIFQDLKTNQKLEKLLNTFTTIEKSLKEYKKKNDFLSQEKPKYKKKGRRKQNNHKPYRGTGYYKKEDYYNQFNFNQFH